MSAAVPIFVVYGMPRCGTTYLYHALGKHPGIYPGYRKESHYFSANYNKGQKWFLSLYDGIGDGQIGADINPMYFLDDRALDRLLEFDRNVKVILGVRHPVEFAVSLYGNVVAHRFDVGSVMDLVEGFSWPLTPTDGVSFALGDNYIGRRIGELGDAFGRNLMLYDFSYFNESTLSVLQAIEQFLGLGAYFDESNIETARINASGRRNPLGLNYLIKNQRLLEAVYAVLPKGLIRLLRTGFDRFLVSETDNPTGASQKPIVSDADRARLAESLAGDIDFYSRLFREAPVVLGDGAVFRTDTSRRATRISSHA